MMTKTFNIYCDESRHLENDHKQFMVLGKVSSAYPQIKMHTRSIMDLKDRHNFFAEIKWSGVSASKIGFYLDLIDYFFSTDLQFRAVVVDKSQINNEGFGQSWDEFYYKMYYFLLNHNINHLYKYNVYLDIKDDLSAYKVHKLKKVLNVQYGVFGNVQNIRSHESPLLQLADFLLGAISYKMNEEGKSVAKLQLIERIEKHSTKKLDQKSNLNETKMNLFFINLR